MQPGHVCHNDDLTCTLVPIECCASTFLAPAGGYSDVVLHQHEGKDWAAVIFEYSNPSSCRIKLAMVDPNGLLRD